MNPAALKRECRRLMALFAEAGAEEVDPGVLLPADSLLDLYGEDIRARAYVTHEPGEGDLMVRPDFTVPVVEAHMRAGRAEARYCYAGPVWRRPGMGESGPAEIWQAGIEFFGGVDSAADDAGVFCLISEALQGLGLHPLTGDIGLALAVIGGLPTSEARKAALRRHIWRPQRFARLLERFAGRLPARRPVARGGPLVGLRSEGEIEARVARLAAEAAEMPLSAAECDLFSALFSVRGKAGAARDRLQALGLAALEPSLARMSRRLDAILGSGLPEPDFDAAHGREAMEYYDGFVFTFAAGPGGPALATGGRYDTLTRVLGRGRGTSAVGAIIRPDLLPGVAP
jgi:ATP phosphoribosyltransferase regulatory subunit